jgi:indolepyruvate ferredoxin oxidoreductase beta subunit
MNLGSIFNILVAGVGGQGNLVCGRSLAHAALLEGRHPVLGDTFGASRRGGSVVSHLRIADYDLGPLVPKGEVDLIIGMEPVEALRVAVHYGAGKTAAVVSSVPVHSPMTLSGEQVYPEIREIAEMLQTICGRVYMLNPKSLVESIDSHRALNVYLLGAASELGILPLDRVNIEKGIDITVGMDDTNRIAFADGIRDVSSLKQA